MKCRRCDGLMVFDRVYGPGEAIFDLPIWRCLNCGATVDPLVIRQVVERQRTGKASVS